MHQSHFESKAIFNQIRRWIHCTLQTYSDIPRSTMNKKSWTASQTQSAPATDSNCFGPKRNHFMENSSFHSILRSKLLYGLETIQLNQSELHRLHAFQIKGCRRILHIPPTSVDRTMTNASAKELLKNHYGVTVVEFSKLWLQRQFQLL